MCARGGLALEVTTFTFPNRPKSARLVFDGFAGNAPWPRAFVWGTQPKERVHAPTCGPQYPNAPTTGI